MTTGNSGTVCVLLGTRKGAFILRGNEARTRWEVSAPHFFGNVVSHFVSDPRQPSTLLAAARTGHLGPTIFHSHDGGKTWTESSQPPAFPKKEGGQVVETTFWLTPGHPSQPGRWYCGTSPLGLFRSDDAGATWESVTGFNENPNYDKWLECGGSPAGILTHSILVDPRDPTHLYISWSTGGTFESLDEGQTWHPLNKGVESDFVPGPPPEYGQDPHCVVQHPTHPDRLYQQNHCGIYRIDRPHDTWERIGNNMPREIRDIGFPIVVHPRDPDTAWVFPMDGTSVWPRTSVGGKPAAYVTHDAGASWTRQDGGLPPGDAWFTVYRQAFASDLHAPVGLYFGTTTGEVWASRDEGQSWDIAVRYLPHILSVETAVLP